MNERMRFNPAEAAAAGETDARSLLLALRGAEEGDNLASLLNDSLAEIIGLAVENRIEECTARLESFCGVMGPVLYASPSQADQNQRVVDEERAIAAALSACCRVSEGRIIAAHPDDDDAIVALAELQLAIRALEPKLTETEGEGS